MQYLLPLASLLAAVTAQNASSPAPPAAAPCVTGNAVHMIVARASLEPPGTGIIGNVSARVAEQLPGSDVVAVDYPATLENYTASEGMGVAAMTTLVEQYAAQCPDSKIVLMGYSQGAQVTADVLCGTEERGFAVTQAVSNRVSDRVAAAVLMGDPSKATNQSFLAGTSTQNGVFPRQSTCGNLADRMVSFCNANDTFCDSGSSIAVHLQYVQNNGTSAVDFVVNKVKGGSSATSNGLASSGAAGTSALFRMEQISATLGLAAVVGLGALIF